MPPVITGRPTPQPTQPARPTQPASSGGGNFFSNMSPEMQAAMVSGGFGMAGGLMAGAGQSKMNAQNNEASAEQAELNRQLQLYLAQMDQRQRQSEQGMAAQQATPNRQDWRQRQALMADIFPGLRNASISAPQDLQRFMPQVEGGFRIPEGGFSKEAMSFFSPEARVSAEADLDRAGMQASGGQMPVPNYAGGGYGQAGQGPAQQVTDYAAQLRQAQQQAQMQGMNNAANRMTQTQTQQQRQQPQGPSTGARIGNALLGAGLAYAGSKWGGQSAAPGQTQQSPWMNMAIQAAGGYFGR
jgi:hypothetical protein